MTTIITEVPVLPRVADDPEALDRERQRLEGEFHRLVRPFLEELQRGGFAGMPHWDHSDVLIQEKDSGRLLVVEAKTSPESIEAEGPQDHAAAGVPASPSFSPEEAEGHYQALGRWKGPLAAKDVQR